MMTMMMIWIMEQARHCCPAGGVAGPAAACQVLQLGVSMHDDGDDGDDDDEDDDGGDHAENAGCSMVSVLHSGFSVRCVGDIDQ